MKAVCWYGASDVRVEVVADPELLSGRDVIVRVMRTAICGSDLHLFGGYIPAMKRGDILGHEFMGEVVEIGREVKTLSVGDRVVVPFAIACGACHYCGAGLWSLCDNSNPNAGALQMLYGAAGAGLFGYSHLYGGYSGGQAEFVRVPFADVGPLPIPAGLSDDKVLFLGDIFPTAYQAAENCDITPGDSIAVWGCGPVGLLVIKSAFMLGADRVFAIDRFPERLSLAETFGKAETLNYEAVDVVAEMQARTAGRGPDACIDAVGMEAHGTTVTALVDRAKQAVRLATDRPHVLREAIQACRKGGVVSIAGVYGGFLDKVPLGAAFAKGLTLKMGQTHVHRYLRPLLERIAQGQIDPSLIITHRLALDEAPRAYEMFRDKVDGCVKVVLDPLIDAPKQ
jgi:threonine dehydrogenase-like Zn-dependent dehydrogenase